MARAKKGSAGGGNLRLIEKTAREVLADPSQQELFLSQFQQPEAYPGAIVWCRERLPASFKLEPAVDFQPQYVDRVAAGERPGTDPLHRAGAYYCLDMSSVFMAAPLAAAAAVLGPAPLLLDLCASPGGKSVLAWRALQPDLLIANEVAGRRIKPLISNLERCRIAPAAVTQADPARWSQIAPQGFDLVLVDAPCSGQSLPLRGVEALGAFHPALSRKNSLRQRRICANAAALVRPGGFLLYTTCTFSRRENEDVVEWLIDRFPEFQPQAARQLEPYRSKLTELPMYRLFPFSGAGAGGFTALLRRDGDGPRVPFDFESVQRLEN